MPELHETACATQPSTAAISPLLAMVLNLLIQEEILETASFGIQMPQARLLATLLIHFLEKMRHL